MTPEPLSVSEDQLFALIGRLYMENLVLRARLAESARADQARPNGMRPAEDRPEPAQAHPPAQP